MPKICPCLGPEIEDEIHGEGQLVKLSYTLVILKTGYLKNRQKYIQDFLIENILEFFSILSSAFTLIIRIMISPKNFGKIAILKICWLVFF